MKMSNTSCSPSQSCSSAGCSLLWHFPAIIDITEVTYMDPLTGILETALLHIQCRRGRYTTIDILPIITACVPLFDSCLLYFDWYIDHLFLLHNLFHLRWLNLLDIVSRYEALLTILTSK